MSNRQVYVLKLDGGYWYVGVADEPDEAYRQHFNGCGGEWTSVHKPTAIEYVCWYVDGDVTAQLTLNLMKRYSIEKVRGYPWTEYTLDIPTIMTIQSIIMRLPLVCWICGVSGHMPCICQMPRCSVCHKHGHATGSCTSSRDRLGGPIKPTLICATCSRHSHSNVMMCPWVTHTTREIVDDLLSIVIQGVTAYRVTPSFTEYCIETNDGNLWMRYSKLLEVHHELVARGIIIDGFPENTFGSWLMSRSKSTMDYRLKSLNGYFKKLPTRRNV